MKRHKLNKTNYSNYQSLFLWINFLWGLISLGMLNQKVEAQSLPAILDLATLTGNQGLLIQGATVNDQAGYSVSNAGDVNGDGKSDILVGAPYAAPQGRTTAGIAYLIYGRANLPTVMDLKTSLTASQGMVIEGAVTVDNAGFSVSGAGDVNGDGKNDILIGAFFASPLGRSVAGEAYLIYGSASLPAVLNLNKTLTAAQGMWIQGAEAGDSTGYSVSNAGDVNGDGLGDILVGAYYATRQGRTQAGIMYLIYGSRTLPAVLDLNTLTAAQGMVILAAAAFDEVGASVSSAGDVNGDGKSDILTGTLYATPQGKAYLIYGGASLPAMLDLNTPLTATQGMMIVGATIGNTLGVNRDISVSGAGDINGDGKSDILIGAYYAGPQGRIDAGIAYLIYGSPSLPAVLNVNTSLTATQGMIISGAAAGDFLGSSVAGAGDVNGDGKNDMLVGAYFASPQSQQFAGVVYLIYGGSGLPAELDLSTLTATQGVKFQGGAANDQTGTSLSGAGDVNGDGKTDILIGAPQSLISTDAGKAYLIYGAAFPAATTTTKTIAPTPQSTATTTTTVIPSTIPASTTIVSSGVPTGVSKSATPSQQGTNMNAPNSDNSATIGSGDSNTTPGLPIFTPPAESSHISNPTIEIAAGAAAGGLALTSCLAAVGFYACRKLSRKNKQTRAEFEKSDIALKNNNNRAYDAQKKYREIDKNKRTENEYEHPQKFLPYEQPNSDVTKKEKYRNIDETKKTEKEYNNVPDIKMHY
jgi:hypothetical protein